MSWCVGVGWCDGEVCLWGGIARGAGGLRRPHAHVGSQLSRTTWGKVANVSRGQKLSLLCGTVCLHSLDRTPNCCTVYSIYMQMNSDSFVTRTLLQTMVKKGFFHSI